MMPPSATTSTEPCSGLPAGPEDEEELALEEARSSGGDGESEFLHGEDLALEADHGASERAEVEQKGGSSDQVQGCEEPVEQPTHVLEEALLHAQERTREAEMVALDKAAEHERVKERTFQAEIAYQHAGGEFAGAGDGVAEAANTPTSVPESVVQEEGGEGDGSAAKKNEEKEDEAQGAEEDAGEEKEEEEAKEAG